jgi:hypothetical protein
MNPSRPFILRPVGTSLLMVAVLLAGAVAYRQLPVSALPEVDYPTIQVTTFYPGASPDVMATSVTAPLERQFGQVPGLEQMTSTSSFGASVITLRFDLALDIDVAEQEVQAAVNARHALPRDLPNPPIYSKVNPTDAPVLTLRDLNILPLPQAGAGTHFARRSSNPPARPPRSTAAKASDPSGPNNAGVLRHRSCRSQTAIAAASEGGQRHFDGRSSRSPSAPTSLTSSATHRS